jgi:hypothetical protein
VSTIKHLADVAGKRVFAEFGTFMLERTIRSFIEFDDTVARNKEFEADCLETRLGADRPPSFH